MLDVIRIASFDIGKKNFAFCIEECYEPDFRKVKNLSPKERYNKDGSPTRKMRAILDAIFENGKLILHKNLNITSHCDPKKKLDPETFHNMVDVLDEYAEFFEYCDIFVIEEQMSFGKKMNRMAMKLGQHCYSYFTFRFGRFKEVIEFPAYYKTQILGCAKELINSRGKTKYKAITKSQRKKWSVEQAMEILNNRGEIDFFDELEQASKRDDLADVLTQLQAFKYLRFVDKSV